MEKPTVLGGFRKTANLQTCSSLCFSIGFGCLRYTLFRNRRILRVLPSNFKSTTHVRIHHGPGKSDQKRDEECERPASYYKECPATGLEPYIVFFDLWELLSRLWDIKKEPSFDLEAFFSHPCFQIIGTSKGHRFDLFVPLPISSLGYVTFLDPGDISHFLGKLLQAGSRRLRQHSPERAVASVTVCCPKNEKWL